MKINTYVFGISTFVIVALLLNINLTSAGGAVCKTCPSPIEPKLCFYNQFTIPDIECNGQICRYIDSNGITHTHLQYFHAEPISTCDLKKWAYNSEMDYSNYKTKLESKGIIISFLGWFSK